MSDVLDALRAAEAAIRAEEEAAAAAAAPETADRDAPEARADRAIQTESEPLLLSEAVRPARPVIVSPAESYAPAEIRRRNALVMAATAGSIALDGLSARLAGPTRLFPAEPAESHALIALGGMRIALELGHAATTALAARLGLKSVEPLFEDPVLAGLAFEAAAAPLAELIERATGVAIALEHWSPGPVEVVSGKRPDRLEWLVENADGASERAALIGDRAIIDLVLDHLGRAAAVSGGGPVETDAALHLPAALRLPSTRMTLAEIARLEPGDVILDGFDWRDLRLCVCHARWRAALEEDNRVSIQETASPAETAVEAELSNLPETAAGSDAEAVDLSDAELAVSFELARTSVPLSTARRLAPGYVFSLDRAVSAEVDIIVSNRRFGRGRIVEIDGEIGVEIVRVG